MSREETTKGGGRGSIDDRVEPVFIVGAARSGTTLLRLILNAHSDLAICGELHFYDQITRTHGHDGTLDDEEDLERAAGWIERTVAFQLLDSGPALLERAMHRLRSRIPCRFDHLHLALLRAYADLEDVDTDRVGEKTPANVRYMERIRRNFPRARFIHLVRDPRAVAASSIDLEANSNDVAIHALTWRCDVFCARAFLAGRPEAVTEIRYEDLVKSPRSVVRNVASFLGVPFEEEMFRFHTGAEDAVRLEVEPWKVGANRPIYRSSVEQWKARLEPVQIRIVESIAGRFLAGYGYERWEGAEVGWGALLCGWIVIAGQYVAAKLDARSLVPEQDETERLVGSDTSMLRSVLVRSLIDAPSRRGTDG